MDKRNEWVEQMIDEIISVQPLHLDPNLKPLFDRFVQVNRYLDYVIEQKNLDKEKGEDFSPP